MKHIAKVLLKNCWFGLTYSCVVILGSLIYTLLAGPLFGVMNAAAVAFMVMVIGIMALAGIASFFRAPNPYSRTWALYDLKDLPPNIDELDSGGSGWIWQAAPIAITAIVLLPFFV
jgi:hypothetical protein